MKFPRRFPLIPYQITDAIFNLVIVALSILSIGYLVYCAYQTGAWLRILIHLGISAALPLVMWVAFVVRQDKRIHPILRHILYAILYLGAFAAMSVNGSRFQTVFGWMALFALAFVLMLMLGAATVIAVKFDYYREKRKNKKSTRK